MESLLTQAKKACEKLVKTVTKFDLASLLDEINKNIPAGYVADDSQILLFTRCSRC